MKAKQFSFIIIYSDFHDHSWVAHLSCHCHSLWREERKLPVWHGGVWASPCSSDYPGGWKWWVQQCQPQPTWLRWSPGAHRVAHVSMHDYRGGSCDTVSLKNSFLLPSILCSDDQSWEGGRRADKTVDGRSSRWCASERCLCVLCVLCVSCPLTITIIKTHICYLTWFMGNNLWTVPVNVKNKFLWLFAILQVNDYNFFCFCF